MTFIPRLLHDIYVTEKFSQYDYNTCMRHLYYINNRNQLNLIYNYYLNISDYFRITLYDELERDHNSIKFLQDYERDFVIHKFYKLNDENIKILIDKNNNLNIEGELTDNTNDLLRQYLNKNKSKFQCELFLEGKKLLYLHNPIDCIINASNKDLSFFKKLKINTSRWEAKESKVPGWMRYLDDHEDFDSYHTKHYAY